MNRQNHAASMTYGSNADRLLGRLHSSTMHTSGCHSVPIMFDPLAGCDGPVCWPATICSSQGTGLTIFSPRLTAMLRPGKAMMSILLISMRAKSTVGTSSSDMFTAPRHGIVSTKGFSVIRAQAFSCRCKTKHKLMYRLCRCRVVQVLRAEV